MSHPPTLPSEISDYIVDLLHRDRKTLGACCLVSKSWIPRARKHLFHGVHFYSPRDIKDWKEAFPDPIDSPAYYTRDLFIWSTLVIPAAVVEGSGWIHAFSNVVRLRVWAIEIDSASLFFKLLCSLPLLEDLSVVGRGIRNKDDDSATFRYPTSPPLTGALSLCLDWGMEPVTRRLLALPNGLHFWELGLRWHHKDDLRCTMAMVEECSGTLQRVAIDCVDLVDPQAGSIDLSKAIRLKEVAFWSRKPGDVWAAMALKTLTPEHTDLRRVVIHIVIGPFPGDERVDTRKEIGEEIYEQWMDLDRVLVHLWESNAIRARVVYKTEGTEKVAYEYIEGLLPEMTMRGLVEMVAHAD